MKNAIGLIKAKSTAYCTVCGCSTRRNLVAYVYENTPEQIEKAKAEISAKATKEYTCKICKSIINSI